MNKRILTISLIVFLGLIFGIYQCFQSFEAENVSAVSIGTPIAGHPWSQMECSGDTLCVDATNKRVGIGTNNPTEKLEVIGNFKASGDVCNGTGNCLSSLATLTNACGAAATTYVYSASAFSGTYCAMGSSTPAAPTFPAAGASTTWTCPVANDPTHPISCTATHAAMPVDGVCGAAQQTYVYSATAYSGSLCSTGTASPISPSFPAIGSSMSWSCLGTNEGSSPSCTASRSTVPFLVNGAHTELNCTAVGGELFSVGASNACRFNSVCPSGWNQYLNWSTTTACTISCNCSSFAQFGSASGHGWSNTAQERSGDTCSNGVSSCIYAYCYSAINQMGCY
jgi:hypothetical protein